MRTNESIVAAIYPRTKKLPKENGADIGFAQLVNILQIHIPLRSLNSCISKIMEGAPKEKMIKNQIYVTKQLQSQMSLKQRYSLDRKLRKVIRLFPELEAERIEVGITTAPFTHAAAKTTLEDRIKIVYNPHYPITYFTLGHELTHFVQDLDEGETGTKIPYGEVQCDVWTLARSELFLDAQPFYLRLPIEIDNNWKFYSKPVRELCIESIKIRKTKRQYLKWLDHELFELATGSNVKNGRKKKRGEKKDEFL